MEFWKNYWTYVILAINNTPDIPEKTTQLEINHFLENLNLDMFNNIIANKYSQYLIDNPPHIISYQKSTTIKWLKEFLNLNNIPYYTNYNMSYKIPRDQITLEFEKLKDFSLKLMQHYGLNKIKLQQFCPETWNKSNKNRNERFRFENIDINRTINQLICNKLETNRHFPKNIPFEHRQQLDFERTIKKSNTKLNLIKQLNQFREVPFNNGHPKFDTICQTRPPIKHNKSKCLIFPPKQQFNIHLY